MRGERVRAVGGPLATRNSNTRKAATAVTPLTDSDSMITNAVHRQIRARASLSSLLTSSVKLTFLRLLKSLKTAMWFFFSKLWVTRSIVDCDISLSSCAAE